MITVSINGASYTGFTRATLMNSIESITGEFTLTATTQPGDNFPVKAQDSITIYVDNTPRLVGYVDSVDIDYDAKTHNIYIRGRDKTCDVIDSTLGADSGFTVPITLEQVATGILSKLGITNIQVKSNLVIAPFTAADGSVEAQVGQSAFSIIEEYCRKRQVLATTDGAGNILFTQSSKTPIKTILFNRVNGRGSNIESARAAYDFSKRYNTYNCFSQGNGSSQVSYALPDQSVDQASFSGVAKDNFVRPTRILNFIAEKSAENGGCQDRATWQANWNRAQSYRYIVTVTGHTAWADGIVWQPNLLVKISDEFANKNEELLISTVNFKYSAPPGGSFTEIQFVARDAYTLQAEQDLRTAQSRTNAGGAKYVIPAET